jgi:hypothetical protein
MLKHLINSTKARIYHREEGHIEEKDMHSWVSRVQILIYLVSFLDALIIGVALWYILRSLQVSQLISIFTGVLSFLIVFPTIMIVDISITTFDTSNFLDTTTQKIDDKKENKIISRIKKINYNLSMAVFFRLIIYGIVFLVSYKSLQFVLNELLEDVNKTKLAKYKKERTEDFEGRKARLKNEINEISTLIYKEVSGTGESKIRGVGPSTKTLQNRKIELEKELISLDTSVAKKVNIDSLGHLSIDSLIKICPECRFVNPPKINSSFFKFILGKDQIYFHELIAAVISLILFLSIIILKVTGGTRINKIYYNSGLQDLYNDYLNGNLHEKHMKEIRDYSEKLDNEYKPSAESFYRWFTNQYPVTERELITDTFQRVQDEKTSYLDSLIIVAEKKKDENSLKYENQLNEYNESEEVYTKLNNELAVKDSLLAELKENINIIENAIKAPVDDEFVINLTKSQNFQKKQYNDVHAEARGIKENINTVNNRKFTQNEKKELIKRLKENDDKLFTSLHLLRNRLLLLFVKQKLKLNYQETGIKDYADWITEVIDFIDKLIDKFFDD